MTDRSRRPRPGEIGAEEREQFEKAGLRSDEDFLDALALDFDEGVKNLAKRVELPVERLHELLARRLPRERVSVRILGHWPDLVLVLGVIALLLLVIRATGRLASAGISLGGESVVVTTREVPAGLGITRDSVTSGFSRKGPRRLSHIDDAVGRVPSRGIPAGVTLTEDLFVPTSAVRVRAIASRDLPPLHVLGSSDFRWTRSACESDCIDPETAVGRYLVRVVLRSDPIRRTDLSDAPLPSDGLAGKIAIGIPVGSGDTQLLGLLPRTASLIVKPRPVGTPVRVDGILILAVTDAGPQRILVGAVTPPQLQELIPNLGSADVFVLDSFNRR